MTEAEWLAVTEPKKLLSHLDPKSTKRRRRLFGCACCQLMLELWPDDKSQRSLELAEGFADGLIGYGEIAPLHREFRLRYEEAKQSEFPLGRVRTIGALACVLSKFAGVATYAVDAAVHAVSGLPDGTEQVHARFSGMLRDIFGNPFRPVTVDPAWRTSTVLVFARRVYESRDFSAMPILADALQDAGCDHPDILDHCRGPGPHVRGCWVVDLVLAKQ